MVKVTPLASTVSDNFFYALQAGEEALLVDPIDADVALKWVEHSGVQNVRILVTHGHPDHVGGNDAVVAALGASVLAPAEAAMFPVAHDVGLRHGDTITLGEARLEALHAPGHTDDHLVYLVGDLLISGDVYFTGGVGHCKFGGEVGELYRTVHERLGRLPDATVLHPGHEYAMKNSAFALHVLPGDEAVQAFAARAGQWTRADGPWCATLGQERTYNLFLRVDEPLVQQAVARSGPSVEGGEALSPAERTFRALRAWRDTF